MCQALTKKRLTADDGEQFDSVEELNQYILDRPKFEEYKGESLKVKEYADKISLLKQYSVSVQGVSKDYQEAVAWFKKAAAQGDKDSQMMLGIVWSDGGFGIEQDYNEAFTWYQKAAEQGDIHSQMNIGYMYEKGLGVEQDYEMAAKWYTQAAEKGNATAQNNLALLYEHGKGVPKNHKKAIELLYCAIENGSSSAEGNLKAIKKFWE